jgi:hypothetical protein
VKSLYTKFQKALTYKYRSVNVPDIEHLNFINGTIRIIDVKLEGKHIKYLLGEDKMLNYGWYFRHEFTFKGRHR